MSRDRPRVVLDTVVFVQYLLSGRGHAAGCFDELRKGNFILLMSDDTFAELRNVPLRPKFIAKYPFVTADNVEALVAEIESLAVVISAPPQAFTLKRDPKDEPFIDLAVAGQAQFIVTWNERHLTYLMKQDTNEGRDFCQRFPGITILSPPAFLKALKTRA